LAGFALTTVGRF